MTKSNIQDFIDLSGKILNEDNPYSVNKKMISDVFKKCESNKVRLTIIDSLYSTNMSLRYFGIQDIADDLDSIGGDTSIIEESRKFLTKQDNRLSELFAKKYGIHKNGAEAGVAISLLSKYLYYVSGYNFPIYDSIVNKNIDKLYGYFADKRFSRGISLFDKIQQFSKEWELSYDQIDNAIWLYGKISMGSISLLVNKNKYLQFSDCFFKDKKSKEVNDKTINFFYDESNDSDIKRIFGSNFSKLVKIYRQIDKYTENKKVK
jgi:hypothetical protein